jgi:hypothetical protein
MFIVAGARDQRSSVIEPFHFYDETDSNAGKTASGRVAFAPPFRFAWSSASRACTARRIARSTAGIRSGSRARPAAADVALPAEGRVLRGHSDGEIGRGRRSARSASTGCD